MNLKLMQPCRHSSTTFNLCGEQKNGISVTVGVAIFVHASYVRIFCDETRRVHLKFLRTFDAYCGCDLSKAWCRFARVAIFNVVKLKLLVSHCHAAGTSNLSPPTKILLLLEMWCGPVGVCVFFQLAAKAFN